jgi:biopolymer transport protein ExbD
MIGLLTGCSTTTIVKDAQNAEIKITTSGEISYRDQTITKEQIPALLKDYDVKRDETIYILVPINQEQRNYQLMRSIADTLKRAGYGRIIFNTNKKATAKLKESTK